MMERSGGTLLKDHVKQAQAMEARPGTVFKGELVLRQIATLKADMQAALDHVDALLIDFTETRALDSTFLQLLCRGHLAMDELKKVLLQAGYEAEQVVPGASPEAFFRHVGCVLGCQDSCLWTDG